MRAFCLAMIFALLASNPVAASPQVGDQAPDFNLQGSDGLSYTLSQFQGKQAVIISFFPKAFTGG